MWLPLPHQIMHFSICKEPVIVFRRLVWFLFFVFDFFIYLNLFFFLFKSVSFSRGDKHFVDLVHVLKSLVGLR